MFIFGPLWSPVTDRYCNIKYRMFCCFAPHRVRAFALVLVSGTAAVPDIWVGITALLCSMLASPRLPPVVGRYASPASMSPRSAEIRQLQHHNIRSPRLPSVHRLQVHPTLTVTHPVGVTSARSHAFTKGFHGGPWIAAPPVRPSEEALAASREALAMRKAMQRKILEHSRKEERRHRRQRRQRFDAAACTVQRTWRGHDARVACARAAADRAAVAEQLTRNRASTTIQTRFRYRAAHDQIESMRAEKRYAREIRAAVCIQRAWRTDQRRRLQRRTILATNASFFDRMKQELESEAVQTMQRAVRQMLQRPPPSQLMQFICSDEFDMRLKAALAIQRASRVKMHEQEKKRKARKKPPPATSAAPTSGRQRSHDARRGNLAPRTAPRAQRARSGPRQFLPVST